MSVQPTPQRWWQQLFADEEAAAYAAQSGPPAALGRRPALLVVDVVQAFIGDPGQTLAESVQQWPMSCGPAAWQALPTLRGLIDLAVERVWPIVYTIAQEGSATAFGGTVKGHTGRLAEVMDRQGAQAIPTEVAPPPAALVLPKPKASAFFATPLLAHLVRSGVDSLVVAGTTTSGCVRATVVDGHSWGFPVRVVEDACFDRARLSHGVSLYEMNAKYADVVRLVDLQRALRERTG